MTLTEDVETTTYRATMENELSVEEEALFLNIAATREVSTAANKTASNGSVTGNEAVRLNGSISGRQLGPGKMLEVMAQDEIDIEVYAYYTGTPGSNSPIADLAFATLIGNAFGGNSSGTEIEQAIQNGFENNVAQAVPSSGSGSNTDIKAYLNYILFNKDFERVDYGFQRVDQGTVSGSHRLLQINDIIIDEPGFLYVYVSNEMNTNFDVFFDELEISHTQGPIIQEDHYYPFGASILALSSTAPLSKPNDYKFNGIEQNTDFDINMYDAFYRNYDPNLGRWWQVDPKVSERESPYVGMGNNPIMYNDYLGDTIRGTDGAPVTYTINDEGQAVWSSNASEDVQRIGNAMLLTNTGTEELDNLMAAEHSIAMRIDEEPNDLGIVGLTQGIPASDEFGEESFLFAEITIFTGNLERDMNAIKSSDNLQLPSDASQRERDYLGIIIGAYQVATLEMAIGFVAAHEAVHATDPHSNSAFSATTDSERMPEIVEMSAAIQTMLIQVGQSKDKRIRK